MAQTIPILPSPDFDQTAGFYELIGFSEEGRWPDAYLILEHPANIELHFFHAPGLDVTQNDHGAYIRFDSDFEAESLYNQWWAASPEGGTLTPPRATDYGLLEFALLDPHGNSLRVGGRLHA
jgi:hypothetical protein